MKTLATLAILGVTGLFGAVGAEAHEGQSCRPEPRCETAVRPEARFDFSFGLHRNYRRYPAERVWIAPRYETRVIGYDSCGRPITRTVCVSSGYWSFRPCR